MENCMDISGIHAHEGAEKTSGTWKKRLIKLLAAIHIEGAEHLSKTK
ncbi:MAG: hypothetical protein ABJN84_06460 [Flavobacteriaceae bacterium]